MQDLRRRWACWTWIKTQEKTDVEVIYLLDSWDAVAGMKTSAHMLENPANKAAMRRIRWAVPFHRAGLLDSQRTHHVTKPPPGPLSAIPPNV